MTEQCWENLHTLVSPGVKVHNSSKRAKNCLSYGGNSTSDAGLPDTTVGQGSATLDPISCETGSPAAQTSQTPQSHVPKELFTHLTKILIDWTGISEVTLLHPPAVIIW